MSWMDDWQKLFVGKQPCVNFGVVGVCGSHEWWRGW